MQTVTLRPKKIKSSLYKLHLKENINTNDFILFENNLNKLLSEIKIGEENSQTEEYFKNLLKDFLENTYYKNKNFINTMSYKGQNEADLVIHSNKDQNSKVSTIFELKKPKNKNEMIAYENIFKKAFYESILYFLWEIIDKQNQEVKNIVISNMYEYFIFDARDLKRVFIDKSSKLETTFKKWRNNQLTDDKTETMYQEIENYIKSHNDFFENLKFTYFDIRTVNQEEKKHLFKIFSPKHLLREVLSNDSNSLNKDFYNELLHIIGLEEVEKDNKKLIQRKKNPDPGSLLENTINIIDTKDKIDDVSNKNYFGDDYNERLYNISLSLCIRWINRILFLKLLEGQLYKYHNSDKSYKFLDPDKINSFDKLNNLFFSVLAKRSEDRKPNIQNEYFRIPYLNSSLFEISTLENEGIDISQLENNLEMTCYKSTVLTDNRGRKLKGQITGLKYLLDFLNSYDFGSEGEDQLNQENKTLINASVLGLIFEKINGYKDGSFYTPGFITTYMCRESIQRVVIQKFNEKYSWNCETVNDLYNKIDDIKEANEIINNLKICDPAVGSGHFLVSALNEIIALKSELGILCDTEGKKLKDYQIENFNDELTITDEEDNFFEYKVNEHTDINPVIRKISKEKSRIQKTLFFEKKHLIENCLFGVDINHNSVMICRLRLWIELLKNAYYTEESNYTELETLPNIDINIKQGNSLISRYTLDVNLGQVFNKDGFRVKDYKQAVSNYKQTNKKEDKKKVTSYLEEIKGKFKSELKQGTLTKISIFQNEIAQLSSNLFGIDKETRKVISDKQKKLDMMIKQKEEIEKSEIYKDAFEWRFEFPEVLNENGDFIGFDVIVGNPPYGILINKNLESFYRNNYPLTSYKTNLYVLFIERMFQISSEICHFIIPKSLLFNTFYSKMRSHLINNSKINLLLTSQEKIFEEAEVGDSLLLEFSINKNQSENLENIVKLIACENFSQISTNNYIKNNIVQGEFLSFDNYEISIISSDSNRIKNKIRKLNKISDYYNLKNGLNPGNIKNILISSDKFTNNHKPIIWGKNISKYSIIWSGDYVNYDQTIINSLTLNDITSKKGMNKQNKIDFALRSKDLFEAKKIVVRKTGDSLISSLDNSNYYFDTLVHGIYEKDKNYPLEYLLGILNSKPSTYFYRSLHDIKGKVFAKISLDNLSSFPIPSIQSYPKNFIDLVNKIIENKKQNIDTSDLEKQIDKMVYDLYELTPDEIAVIEGQ